MVTQVDAVFEHGVLRPLESPVLPESEVVRVTVELPTAPRTASATRAYNDRREEFEWLATESAAFAGQWVALDGKRLIAHGTELATVRAAARAARVPQPLLTHLPAADEPPFGGW